jgi:dienelactone hydrolase
MKSLRLPVTLWLLTAVTAAAQPPFDAAEAGRAAIQQLVKGDFAAFMASSDEKMRTALPEEKLRSAWANVQAQAGAFKQMRNPRVSIKGEYQVVLIEAEFEKATAEIQIAFNASRQIAGFNIRPAAPAAAFTDASYVSRDRFSERAVTIDAGGWPLPGVLAIPSGVGPFPAVVLVHGSGPGDRDQTIGPNKPFRDLALGLASRGVAVLRYDKRTRAHGGKMASLPQLTVKEEVIDDAIAAVKLLRATEGIDPKRIFVAGHSLGGMLVPRIAAAGAEVSGVIILAGAVRSLEQSIADQTRYLALADGKIAPDEQPLVDEAAALVERVKALKDGDPPISFAGISAPASYWLDLRGYNPPNEAQKLKLPMLVLQGERDYQVTMEDFAKWKAAVGSRAAVMLKSYPGLNHLFMPGAGPSVPAEYMTAGHVAEEVVRDIASWVASGTLPVPPKGIANLGGQAP